MKPETAKLIKSCLEGMRIEMIGFLEQLVNFETPSHNPDAQKNIMDTLKARLKLLDFQVELMPGKKTGGYLYARPKKKTPHSQFQMMIGHCDTVWPIGTLKEMPLVKENGKISGPGIYDMKAGLTQMLFALQAIRQLQLECSVTPVILINSDEEIGSKESTNAITRLAKRANRAFVLEPPLGLEGKLKTARKGLGRFTITIKGKAAHAGLNPEQGVSAIVELSRQIQYLFAMNDPEKGISVNVGMISGGISPNVIAPESSAVIDVRVLTKEDADMIGRKIRALKPEHPEIVLEVDGYFGRPPMERTHRNQQLWQLARETGKLIGLELEQSTAGGGSDGNTTSLFTATLDGLGTTGDGAHAAHEFIFTEKLIERTTLLTLLLLSEPQS